MPSLGGLLKKRRTKDSQTLSKELPVPERTDHPSSNTPDGDSASMQPAVASQASPHHGQSSNAASINNIINNPANSHQHSHHHGAQQNAQATHTGTGQAAQKERTTKGKYSQEDFVLQRTLGTGSFGRVHLVQSKHNHRFYAMKVLKKAQVVKMKQIEHTNDERRMLNRVRHPFLVTLWGTWQDSRNLYMVMDFVEGGELFSLLRKSQVSRQFSTFPAHAILPLWLIPPVPSKAISKPGCKILRCRSDLGPGVPTPAPDYLSRFEARESSARSPRAPQDH